MSTEGQDEDLPRIEDRGGRWSPLALGIVSLVCDPFLIPTVLAIARGLSELREVRAREARGYWHPEHARVRTGAVWGMLLGASRILLVVLVVLLAAVAAAVEPVPRPVPWERFGSDELTEVRERLASEDDDVRAMAARHLLAMGPDLSGGDVALLLADAEGDLRDGALDVRSTLVRACAAAEEAPPDQSVPVVRRLYPRLDAPGRSAALRLLASMVLLARRDAFAPGGEEPWAAFLDLAASERVARRGLRLPVEELAMLARTRPELFPEAWERVDAGSPLSADLVAAAAQHCVEQPHTPNPDVYTDGLPRARDRWRADERAFAAPAEPSLADLLAPERARRAREATVAIALLGCEDARTLDLTSARAAARSNDPRVALAGVRRWHVLEHSVPDEILQRLAREPLVRAQVFALLAPVVQYQQHGIPSETWSAASLIEARFVEHVAALELDYLPREITLRGRQVIALHEERYRGDDVFFVFDVVGVRADGSEARETGIAGPYPNPVEDTSGESELAAMWLAPSQLDAAGVYDVVEERFAAAPGGAL